MTAQTARLLVDGNGIVIPNQYYDVVTNSFKASEGGTGISVGGTEVSSNNPLPVAQSVGGTEVSSNNPLPVVSKKSKRVSITGITVAASPHAAKTVCGGLLTTTGILTSGIDTGVLVSVNANFKPAVTGVYVLHGFSSQPSTIADNAAFALTAEDCDKKVCTIPLTLAAYNNTGGVIKASFQVSNIQHAIESTAGQMWWYLVTETAWTPTSTTDLYDITIGVAKD